MTASSVDITADVADARREAARAEFGSPYGELMATYVELGELLNSDTHLKFLPGACRILADQLVALDTDMYGSAEARWFARMARETTFGGGGVE